MRTLIITVSLTMLANCNPDPTVVPSDGGRIEQTILSGTVHLIGPISGAEVQAFVFTDGIQGEKKGSAKTDANGLFELQLGPAYGDFLLVATVEGKQLKTIVTNVETQTTKSGIIISPFLWLSTAYFKTAYENTNDVVEAKKLSNALVFGHMGNLPHDRTPPAMPSQTTTIFDNALASGLILRAMEHQAQAALPTATLLDFLELIVDDLEADGFYDGRGKNGQLRLGTMDLDHCTVRANLATHLTLYMKSKNNQTPFTAADVAGIAGQIANNNEVIFNAPVCAIDREPPKIKFKKPSNLEEVSATIDILAEVEDEEAHLQSVYAVEPEELVGEASIAANGISGTWVGMLDTSKFDDGDLTIVIGARDSAGNESQEDIIVRIRNGGDQWGPTFVWDVESGTPTNQTIFTPSGRVYDVSGVVEARFDNEVLQYDASGAFTASPKALKDGENSWAYFGVDGLSNETSGEYKIIRDKVPPEITVEKPKIGEKFIDKALVEIAGTCSDTYGIKSLDVKINSSQMEDYDNSPESLVSNFTVNEDHDEGPLTMVFTCVDQAGNQNQKDVKIEIIKTGGITGTAIKGKVVGGTVRAYSWEKGEKGNIIDSQKASTDQEGSFTIGIGPHDGNYVLLEQKGGQYKGEGRSNYEVPVSFGPNDKMQTLVFHKTADNVENAKITPWTTVATILAENLVQQNLEVEQAADDARSRVEAYVQFDLSTDCLNCREGLAVGFNDEARCGLLLSGLSYFAEDLGYNALELLRLVYDDLRYDMLLNGKGTGGQLTLGQYQLDANTLRAKLARATKQFMDSPLNANPAVLASNLPQIQKWLDEIAGNMDPMFDPNQPPYPVDIEPPVITADIAQDTWVNGTINFQLLATDTDQTVRFDVISPVSNPPYLTYKPEKVTEAIRKIDVYVQTTSITDGNWTITSKAEDRSRNISMHDLTLRVDNKGPTVTWSYPSDGLFIETDTGEITVTGTVHDAGIGYKPNTLQINEILATVEENGDFSVVVPVEAGENTLSLVALDRLDNPTHENRTVTIKNDLVAPVITFTCDSCTNIQDTWQRGTINVVAEATDDEQMASFLITNPLMLDYPHQVIDAKTFRKTFTLDTTTVANGGVYENYLVYYSATDHVGNEAEQKVLSFDIDNARPTFANISPTNGETRTITNGKLTVSGAVMELGSGLKTLTVTNQTTGDTKTVAEEGEWAVEVDVVAGDNVIVIRAEDNVGNVHQLPQIGVFIITDVVPPQISFTCPERSGVFPACTNLDNKWVAGFITMIAEATDDEAMHSFEITSPGEYNTRHQVYDTKTYRKTFTLDTTTITTNGVDTKNVEYTAVDHTKTESNTVTKTLHLKIDNQQPPNVTWNVYGCSGTMKQQENTITCTGTANDGTGSGIASVSINGHAAANPTDWEISVPVQEGNNNLRLLVTDRMGNQRILNRPVEIDQDYTPPAIQFVTPTPGENEFINTNYAVRAIAVDTKSELSYFVLRYQGLTCTDGDSCDNDPATGGIQIDYTVPNNREESVVFTATARDSSEQPNEASLARTIRTDTKGPSVEWVYPTEGQYAENTYREVNALLRVIDSASGVATVTMDGVQATLDVDNKYRRRYTNVYDGWHTINATATDNLGNTTETTVTYHFFCTIADLCY